MIENSTFRTKKEEIKARRLVVAELLVKGYSQSEILDEVNYGRHGNFKKISMRTLKQDCAEIRQGRIEALKKFIETFDIHDFWAQRIMENEKRRQALWEVATTAEHEAPQVSAIQALSDLNLEDEQILNKLGVKTSQVPPEDVAAKTLIIFRDKAPASEKDEN